MESAVQLEFPLEDCLSLEEKVNWMRKEIDEDKESLRKCRKKLFMDMNQIRNENRDLKKLLNDLLILLNKSQS